MTCFTCQSQISDYLDNTLSAEIQKEADRHIEKCEECRERFQHYQLIIANLAKRPRAHLPSSLKKSPLGPSVLGAGMGLKIFHLNFFL